MTITGTGSLTVHGNANDGIAGKDDLVIESGTITVDPVDDGIRGNDYWWSAAARTPCTRAAR